MGARRRLSSIQKLSIQGVRSFDSAQRETIHFYTPLTLIVGHNGSGKTTIIECLRYATTGDLPPNSKGGAFIHDPKIANMTEVLAQVKLGFTNTSGVPMVCTRSMQLVMKKATRTFKTLEGQLMVNAGGERSTISTRCAELDTLIPNYLGVSRAVLDYVVFCHQDESLWPLSEPAALKKRFDEIFEAMKYTKALDSIKALRKEQAVDIKFQQQSSDHLKTDRDRADKIQARIDQLADEIAGMREAAAALNQDMQRVTAETDSLFKSAQAFEKVLVELDQRVATRAALQDQHDRLRANVPAELDAPTEDLQYELDEFAAQADALRADLGRRRADVDARKLQIVQARAQHADALVLEGQLNAEAEAHARQLVRRADITRELGRKLGIAGYDVALDDAQIADFGAKLASVSRQHHQTVARIRRDAAAETDKVQAELERLRVEKSGLELQVRLANDTVAHSRAEIDALTQRAAALAVDDDAVRAEAGAVAELDAALDAARAAFDAEDWAARRAAAEARVKDLEARHEAAGNEIMASNKRMDTRARLTVLQDDADRRKKGQATLVAVHGDKFRRLAGAALDAADAAAAEAALGDATDALRDRERDQTRELDLLSKDLGALETRYSILKDALARKQTDQRDAAAQYEDVMGDSAIDGYEAAVDELEKSLAAVSQTFEQSSFIMKYYAAAVELARAARKCSLCHHQFANDRAVTAFAADIDGRLAAMPVTRDQAEEQVRQLQEDLDAARDVGGQVARYRELGAEIPAAEAELAGLARDIAAKSAAIEQQRGAVDAVRDELGQLDLLRRPVGDMVRAEAELAELAVQIDACAAELLETGSNRTVKDIQRDRQQLAEELRQCRGELQQAADDRELQKGQIQRSDNQARDRRLALEGLRAKLKAKQELGDRIETLRAQIAAKQSEIEVTRIRTEAIVPDIAKQASTLDEVKRHFAQQEQAANKELTRVSAALSEFEAIQAEVGQYREREGDGRLQRARQSTQALADGVARQAAELEQAAAGAAALENQLADLKSHERALADNLQLRQLRQEMAATDEAVAELRLRNAERDRDRYEQDVQRLRTKYARLNAEYGSKIGEIKQMDDQLARHRQELTTEFLDVHSKYRETVIRLKTTKAASEDLAKYGMALDNAIMRFHSLKMEEINRIIDELWKKTYSGTDVDAILIRSDSESAKGNRSYNYRVCMVKNDVELDMRGRCSAGQKVLASIIIRLALAECFGVNCGLIALDEPTTNLDRENVESLARSLGSIIDTRRSQRNFQLIVITHDEDFLRYMNSSDYCEHYFRVSRNERQKSEIDRQEISKVL
ncbi:uncharacterized protein V1510DRAFT_432119 [Dipodascopsis tothii]|uniref:uncharacterized protein n=1 Tax=Dipodascopsis tothii TaxID=44089 RepID=UPI0034CFA141